MSHDRHSTLRGPVAHGRHHEPTPQHPQHGHREELDATRHQPQPYSEPSSPPFSVLPRPEVARRMTSDHQSLEPPCASGSGSASTHRPLSSASSSGASTSIATSMNDGPNTIRINVLAPYIEQGPSRPRGYPIDRSMTISQLKDALCRGEYGGMPCRRDKMKIIWKGRLLEEGDVLGQVVGPKSEPGQVHSFILIAVSPHHIYTPTPLDTDTSGSKSYFTRRTGGGAGISPRPSRPSTPGVAPDTFGQLRASAISNSQLPDPPTLAVRAVNSSIAPPTGSTVDSPCIPSGLTSAFLSTSPTVLPPTPNPFPNANSNDAYRSTLQATADSTHFTLFLARHHLFRFLGKAPLKWDAMHPQPVMRIEEATEAVKGVVLALLAAMCRDDGEMKDVRQEVMGIFDGLEYAGAEVEVERLRDVWERATGRTWAEEGNEVDVEVDFTTTTLHIPSIGSMTASQRHHLFQYLRLTRSLPLLNLFLTRLASNPPSRLHAPANGPPALASSSHHSGSLTGGLTGLQPTSNTTANSGAAPTPTPTIPLVPAAQNVPAQPARGRRIYQLRVHVSLPLLKHALTSLVQIAGMIWMLTPRMKWTDTRFWIICFAAMGYWVGDLRRVQVGEARARARRAEREAARRAAEEPIPATGEEGLRGEEEGRAMGADAGAPGGGAQQDTAGGQPGQPAQGPAPTPAARLHRLNGRTANTPHNPLASLAHLHLTTESQYLQLPTDPSGQAQLTTPRPRSRPARIITQALLPFYLFYMTLVPPLEEMRAKAIRKRERAIRVIVGEMNPPLPSTAERAAAMAEQRGGGGEEGQGGDQDQAQGQEQEGEQPRETIFPEGLDEIGKAYYRRVLDKGEGIDWEEEREAQRAAEAEFGGGGGNGWD